MLSRPARSEEVQALVAYMQARPDRDAAACRDVVWALLDQARSFGLTIEVMWAHDRPDMPLPVRIVKQLLQAIAERRRKCAGQVASMSPTPIMSNK